MNPILKATHDLGQSVWLDFISRDLLQTGALERLVAEGLRGLTSNPTIFENAISKGTDYDKDVLRGVEHDLSPMEIFENLAIADLTAAADMLGDVYKSSGSRDGFVSLEVSPKLAHNTNGTIEEAKRLWKRVNRPNLMIKVPGTTEGMPAIKALLVEGLNVNITLLFSLKQYRDVLETYITALEERAAQGKDISKIGSVASFFVSRVDTVADAQLIEKGRKDLAAKTAIANACHAYRHFMNECESPRWKALAAKGANVQRPLWASTSTKNPDYSDVLYVDELIAKDTVNTMPPATLEAFKDHGRPSLKLLENMKKADAVLAEIEKNGVSLDKITHDLIEDGVVKFAKSFDGLLQAIRNKMESRRAAATH
jgi:transaldolase/glucose-6-phosphate isomerase